MNNTNQEKRVPEKLERIRNEWRDLDMTNMLVTLTDKINEILSYLSVKEERVEKKSYSECCKTNVSDFGVCKKCKNKCVEVLPLSKDYSKQTAGGGGRGMTMGNTTLDFRQSNTDQTEPKEEDWREEFDKTFVNKFGAENLHLCLVPSITENNKLWVVEIVTKDIKSFISNLLSKSKEEEKNRVRGIILSLPNRIGGEKGRLISIDEVLSALDEEI